MKETKTNEVKSLFHITTYKQVCKELGERAKKSPFDKIKQLEKLFNNGWVKDLKNKKQWKYYPVFEIDANGSLVFSWSFDCYGDFVGEACLYKDQATSDHIGKHFTSIYQELAES